MIWPIERGEFGFAMNQPDMGALLVIAVLALAILILALRMIRG